MTKLPKQLLILRLKNLMTGMMRLTVNGKLLKSPTQNTKANGKQKKISNPAYKGAWVHPEIPNPDYKEDKNIYLFKDIGSIGIDIWQVKSGTIFDNIIITDSVKEAETFLAETYTKSKDAEKEAFESAEKKKKDEEEAARKKSEEKKPEEDEDEDDDEDNHAHDEL